VVRLMQVSTAVAAHTSLRKACGRPCCLRRCTSKVNCILKLPVSLSPLSP
jgi:hypothetical protein